MHTTGFFTHPDCLRHEMGPGHPERPERLGAITRRLQSTGLLDALVQHEAPPAAPDHLRRAHAAHHIDALRAMADRLADDGAAYAAIDPDTSMNRHTWAAAERAAGAAVAATDAVIAGTLQNAFCAVRPPGHHAERDRAMGFCFFNNVAIAALHALEHHGLQRVAVVDFDVHHGNGTEDILAGDPRVLMVGLFQHPLYPYSGTGEAAANMLNVPLPAHTRGAAVRAMVEATWVPRLDAFRPEMVFISAGFDAHQEDGLAQMGLIEDDYTWLTERILGVAQRHGHGRVVSCLEGGYALDALGRSVEAHLRVLAGASQ